MKPIQEKRQPMMDNVRNVFYPLVPLIAIASIWSLAWARSLEDYATRNLAPQDADPSGMVTRLTASRERHRTEISKPLFTAVNIDN